MARLAIHLLIALDMTLMIWGQQTPAPIIPTFPPPPTMNAVINESVFVFVGEPVIVNDRMRVVIDCGQLIDRAISDGISNPTVTWIKDGLTLSNGSATNVVISPDRRRLIITDTLLAVGGQLGNDGNYTCDICMDYNVPDCANESDVCVCGEPNLSPPAGPGTVAPTFISITCGQNATIPSLVPVFSLIIQCTVFNGSSPVPQVFKDGVLIGSSFPLTILSPTDDDFGTYTFALTTCCGSTQTVSRIIRQGDPPDIDEGPFEDLPSAVPPGDRTVTINTPAYIVDGFDLTLICNIASGTPPITIMWLRDGRPYPAGGNNSMITVSDYTDGENITCRAENDIGFDMETTTVNVFEPPQILPIPIPTPPPGETTVSTGRPSNTTVETGTSVTIYCPSSGIDTPGIQWFRDGAMVVDGGRFRIITPRLAGAAVTSALRIDDFQPATDSGTYTCTSTNRVGLADGGTTLMGDVCPRCPPPGFETPNPDGCPFCSVWQTGDFGPCSLECHRGTQTRPVFCVDFSTNMRVDIARCDPSAEPSATRRCGTGPCASGWRRGEWSKCSTTCQTGHQKREVVCTVMGELASEDQCDPGLRPRSERFCNQHIKCFPCKDVSERHCRRLARTMMGCMSDYARDYCCWSCRND